MPQISKLAGFLTHQDQYNKLHFIMPYNKVGQDIYGTFKTLSEFKKKHKNFKSPMGWEKFIVKADTKIHPGMIQRMCILDVTLKTYNYPIKSGLSINGWTIKLNSIKLYTKTIYNPVQIMNKYKPHIKGGEVIKDNSTGFSKFKH